MGESVYLVKRIRDKKYKGERTGEERRKEADGYFMEIETQAFKDEDAAKDFIRKDMTELLERGLFDWSMSYKVTVLNVQ